LLWLGRLLGRRARLLGGAVDSMNHTADPLVITEVKQDDFTLTLPGSWRQRRTPDGFELAEAGGPHRLTIRVKRLLSPVADGALPALVDRVLDEHRRLSMNAVAEVLAWDDSELLADHRRMERRSMGVCPAQALRVALLALASSRDVLSATLVYRKAPGGGPTTAAAFSALATVIFDQLHNAQVPDGRPGG
jgi:hypothetical protein